jgi:hypothetical protein
MQPVLLQPLPLLKITGNQFFVNSPVPILTYTNGLVLTEPAALEKGKGHLALFLLAVRKARGFNG